MESFDRGSTSRVGRTAAALVTLAVVVLSGAALALAPEPREASGSLAGLPDSAESTAAAKVLDRLPRTDDAPAVVVVGRDDGLRADDRAAIDDLVVTLQRLGDGDVPPPTISDDGTLAVVTVPLDGSTGPDRVPDLRDAVSAALPSDLTAHVTGGPAFQADLADVFAGADVRLLVATASVVALLLLLTYRSPWLWLVPLTVVAVGDRVAAGAVATATRLFGYTVDGSTIGITSVLVFGAGTNYALLLIARYREELRAHPDRFDAMRVAWRRATPAVLASSGTVVLALLTLTFADAPSNRALGWSGAIGIVVAVLYGLVALPAAMLLFGRGLFWPFVPRPGQADPARHGVWARVGRTVVRRPRLTAALAGLLLGALALGVAGVQVGLTQNERFRDVPDSVLGQEQLAEAFPAGSAEPTTVVTTPNRLESVAATVRSTEGVAAVRPGPASDRWATLSVVLDDGRASDGATATIERLRDALPAPTLVGGPDAEDVDARAAAAHDRGVVIPLVLAIVLAILLALLRSPVAATVLVLTVVVTYASAMGAGWLVLTGLLDQPALDQPVPLFAFVFLVALGVDYNIFLSTRAREESASAPMAGAMTVALAVTGGVITSAGVVLAAVFAVLGVLPLVTLTQIGVVVGIGILLDTLVVRSLLVPALATLIGERFWWPRHPAGRAGGPS